MKNSYRESWDIRFCSFGPNWDQTAEISLLGQGIRRSLALAKYLLILSPTIRKNLPFVDTPTKCLSPSTKYQFPCFNPVKTSFLAFYPLSLLLYHFYFNFIYSFYTHFMLILISINVQCLQNVVFSFEKGSNSQDQSSSDSQQPNKGSFSCR